MRIGKRLLALNLAMLLVIVLLPLQAFAAEVTPDTPVSYVKTADGAHEQITFTAPESGFYEVCLTSPDHPDYYVVDSSSTYGEMQLYADADANSSYGPSVYWLRAGEQHVFYAKANEDPDWLRYQMYVNGQDGPAEDAGTWNVSVRPLETVPIGCGEAVTIDHDVMLAFRPAESGGYVITRNGEPVSARFYDEYGFGIWSAPEGMFFDAGVVYYIDGFYQEGSVISIQKPPREGAYGGYNDNTLRWSLSRDGVMTISGSGEAEWNVLAPARFYSKDVREVVIGRDVIVNGHLFYIFPNLEKITIDPENTTCVLENGLLMSPDRTKLYRVLPEVTGNFTVPETVTEVAEHAFSSAMGLTALTVSESGPYLGYGALYPLDTLRDLYCPGLKEYCDAVDCNFDWMEQKPTVHYSTELTDGNFEFAPAESGDGYALTYCAYFADEKTDDPEANTTYRIPATFRGKPVTGIRAGAFSHLRGEGYVLSGADVYIPETVTVIEDEAFPSTNIGTFIVHPDNPVYCDRDGVLYTRDGKDLMSYPRCKSFTLEEGRYDVPEGTERIHAGVFSYFGPKALGLPLSLKQIQARAFEQAFVEEIYYAGTKADWETIDIVTSPGDVESWMGNNSLVRGVVNIHFAPPSFTDVEPDAYYAAPVAWAVEQGITQGTGKGTFSPDATCTRGQIVTFLWRAAGEPEPETTVNPFTDVSPDDYYYKAVLWAVEQNITQGTGSGQFSPGGECTRGQVVTFLHRFAGSPATVTTVNPFADVADDAYYAKAVLWAVDCDITQGTGGGKFSPDMTCTRGQIVTFLYRDMA